MAGRNTATGHSSGQTYPQKVYRNCNQVAQEQIWSENVYKEHVSLKRWKKNWGFMTEYDVRGQVRHKKELPKEVKFYKEDVPTTTARQYGLRLESPSSKKISQLERLTSFHKKKSGLEENYT